MNDADFDDLAEALAEHVVPRIPELLRDGVYSALDAGETEIAVRDLAATILKRKIPLTAGERDDLLALWVDMGEPASKLDGLKVV